MQDKLTQARDLFGSDVVEEVQLIVEQSDPDGAYSLLEDFGKFEHAECVEFLYFEE